MKEEIFGAYITGAHGQSQNLYEKRNEWKRGRGSNEEIAESISLETRDIVKLEKENGLDFILDPMFSTYYLFQPLSEGIDGVKVGPQENWFNNNVFYWRLQIEGPLKMQTGFSEKFLHLDLLPKDGTAMVVLPSPYSLFILSDVTGYSNKRDAIKNLSEILHAEATHLVSKGVGRIQYDEPAIVVKQSLDFLLEEDLDLLQIGMEICGKVDGASTSLHTYFGDAGPIISNLLKLPVNCVGIDCTETSVKDIIKHKYYGKELALGFLDSRSTSLEGADEVVKKVMEIEKISNPKKIYVVPNTGTEYRGFRNGMRKINLLAEIKRKLNG